VILRKRTVSGKHSIVKIVGVPGDPEEPGADVLYSFAIPLLPPSLPSSVTCGALLYL
jgi:hypothetical protein